MQEEEEFDIFLDAGLPVNQADMAKPTQDFVVDLIKVFLNTFHIDGYSIAQGTKEQFEVLICEDRELYSQVMKTINLHVVMAKICGEIFLKDLPISDITSPTPKRTMKLAKFLANFVLYYKNKLSEIEENVNYLKERRNIIDEYNFKKKDACEKIAASKIYREERELAIEKLKVKIEETRKKIGMKQSVMNGKKEDVKNLEQERNRVAGIYAAKQSEASKAYEKTGDLQAQVVNSPDELRGQLRELEKQKELKKREGEEKYESMKAKKKLLEYKEHIHALIQGEVEKLVKVLESHSEEKEASKKLKDITKKQEMIQEIHSKLEKDQEIQKNHCSVSEMNELVQRIEQRLSPLHDQSSQLSKEKKQLEVEIEGTKGDQQRLFLKIDKMGREIAKVEEETSSFLKECQELYRNEISAEFELSKVLSDFLNRKTRE